MEPVQTVNPSTRFTCATVWCLIEWENSPLTSIVCSLKGPATTLRLIQINIGPSADGINYEAVREYK